MCEDGILDAQLARYRVADTALDGLIWQLVSNGEPDEILDVDDGSVVGVDEACLLADASDFAAVFEVKRSFEEDHEISPTVLDPLSVTFTAADVSITPSLVPDSNVTELPRIADNRALSSPTVIDPFP